MGTAPKKSRAARQLARAPQPEQSDDIVVHADPAGAAHVMREIVALHELSVALEEHERAAVAERREHGGVAGAHHYHRTLDAVQAPGLVRGNQGERIDDAFMVFARHPEALHGVLLRIIGGEGEGFRQGIAAGDDLREVDKVDRVDRFSRPIANREDIT